jgi:hypothetical protein
VGPGPKICFCIFQRATQSKQLRKSRNFAQSGHPAGNILLLLKRLMIKDIDILVNLDGENNNILGENLCVSCMAAVPREM